MRHAKLHGLLQLGGQIAASQLSAPRPYQHSKTDDEPLPRLIFTSLLRFKAHNAAAQFNELYPKCSCCSRRRSALYICTSDTILFIMSD
jgi:hypothetical protein